LGSMDDNFCILIQLAIYLESFLYQYLNAHYLFTEDTSERAVTKLKNRYSNQLNKFVWKTNEFELVISQQDKGKGVGTHSQRKFPATYATRQGCLAEEIEIRGRWKQTHG